MNWKIYENGEHINTIVADEEWLKGYCERHGYTYKAEEPTNPPEPSPADRIAELKANLSATDYQAIKYAEGWISEAEYAPIKAQRQAWRDEINELEATQ